MCTLKMLCNSKLAFIAGNNGSDLSSIWFIHARENNGQYG